VLRPGQADGQQGRGASVRISPDQSYALFEKHGCFVNEVCDKCGQILGSVRFTRVGESGEWCSRECRDGAKAHAPGTCKSCKARMPEGKRRGALYCDDSCRKSAARSRSGELSRTKRPIYAGFCADSRAGRHEALTDSVEAQNGAISA
jgi:hypothetical protein